MNTPMQLAIGGRISIKKRNTITGKTEQLQQKNLILDSYLQRFFLQNEFGLLNEEVMNRCHVGDGIVQPSPTDTGLSGDTLAVGTNPIPIYTPVASNLVTGTSFNRPADSGAASHGEFSPDGNFFAVAHSAHPFVTVYEVVDGKIMKRLEHAIPALPSTGTGCAFSPDGQYLAVTHAVSPFISVFKREGLQFVKLENPMELPTGAAHSCSFSTDGSYLVVGHAISPWITIYRQEEDTFTKLANPTDLPGATVNQVFFRNGLQETLICYTSSTLIVYQLIPTDTFHRIQSASFGTSYGVDVSPSGEYICVGQSSSGESGIRMRILRRQPDLTYTTMVNHRVAQHWGSGSSYGMTPRFSSDNQYLVIRWGSALSSGSIYGFQLDGGSITELHTSGYLSSVTSGIFASFPFSNRFAVVGTSANSVNQLRLDNSEAVSTRCTRWVFPPGIGTGIVREVALQASAVSSYANCWVARQVLQVPIDKGDDDELIVDWTIDVVNPSGASGTLTGGSRDGSDLDWIFSLSTPRFDNIMLNGYQSTWFGLRDTPRVITTVNEQGFLTDTLLPPSHNRWRGESLVTITNTLLRETQAYIAGSLKRVCRVKLRQDDANSAFSGLLLTNNNDHDFGLFVFEPPLNKDSNVTLDLDIEVGLERGV